MIRLDPPAAAARAVSQSRCFVCGQDNPQGLRIPFETQPDGSVTGVWKPGETWEGFQGIVHGGIVSTVLDEAMSKAVAATGTEALTAELRVRFRHPAPSGASLQVRGRVVRRLGRLFETEADLAGPGGIEYARASAKFLAVARPSLMKDNH